MIIEFIGVPGAGKTTLRDRLAERLGVIPGNGQSIESRLIPRRERLFRYPVVLWKWRRAIALALRILRSSSRTRSEKHLALRRLVVILWSYDQEAADRTRIAVLGEGYLQMGHMLMLEGPDEPNDAELEKLLCVGPRADLTVYVRARPEDILERLEKRDRGLPPRLEQLPYPMRIRVLNTGSALFDAMTGIIRHDDGHSTYIIEVVNDDLDRAVDQIVSEYDKFQCM